MHMFINIQYLSYKVIHNKYMQSYAIFMPLLNDCLSTELKTINHFSSNISIWNFWILISLFYNLILYDPFNKPLLRIRVLYISSLLNSLIKIILVSVLFEIILNETLNLYLSTFVLNVRHSILIKHYYSYFINACLILECIKIKSKIYLLVQTYVHKLWFSKEFIYIQSSIKSIMHESVQYFIFS